MDNKDLDVELFTVLKDKTRLMILEFDTKNLKKATKKIKKEDLKRILIDKCTNMLEEDIELIYNDLER